jgi:hypothetical protein
MTTVKILKSERSIISEGLAQVCMEHGTSDIEGDDNYVNLSIDTDSAVIMFHLALFCGRKIQIVEFNSFIENCKKDKLISS